MTRRLRYALLTVFALFHAGCGYFMAGTWHDHPGNWERAFRSKKPDDVIVVHSKYWRSPHWSYEFSYFFEIAPNPKLRDQLLTENKLRRVIGDEAATAKQNVFGETPAWFAPKTVTEYDVRIFAEARYRNFVVLIDRESGRMFLSDFLV